MAKDSDNAYWIAGLLAVSAGIFAVVTSKSKDKEDKLRLLVELNGASTTDEERLTIKASALKLFPKLTPEQWDELVKKAS